MQTPLTFFFAFVVVLALIGLAAWLVRRFAGNRLGANANRGRMPRLAVIDAAAVDGRRRLVLVRRDNIEHLLMIGGPTDIVVEQNIVRAMPRVTKAPGQCRRGRTATAGCCLQQLVRQRCRPHHRNRMPRSAAEPNRPFDEPRRRASERRSDPLAGFTPETPAAPTSAIGVNSVNAASDQARSSPVRTAWRLRSAPWNARLPPPPSPALSAADCIAEMAQRWKHSFGVAGDPAEFVSARRRGF